MTFSDIINEISRFSPIQVISSSSDTNISRVRLWAGQAESEMSTILYFGYDRQPGVWPDHYILAADAGLSGAAQDGGLSASAQRIEADFPAPAS